MQVLTMEEVNAVSGAMTTNQCIGIHTLVAGGVGGALLGGIGAFGGSGLGLAIGGAFGLIVCD